MKLIDSHCHLNFPDFEGDLPQVLENAQKAGVCGFLTVNTRLSEALTLQDIAQTYSSVVCSVGVHPHEAAEHDIASLKNLLKGHLQHPRAVALGETGLDYYYKKSPPEIQQESFSKHLELGCEEKIPIIIHTRAADEDTLRCLDAFPQTKGVFHCFTGSAAMAQAGLERGLYISFSGIITFKKSEALREVVAQVPLDRLLVETDAPFLTPHPYRGKRNEPAYTCLTAQCVADIKGVSLEEVAHTTTQNFYNLFSKARGLM